MATLRLKIYGMRCDGCAERIHRLLSREPGVREARVSYPEAGATITYNSHSITETKMRDLIARAGFVPRDL